MTKSIKTHHYTYIIRHINGRYYIGRHSSKKDPLLDSYMGSGKWVKSIKDRSTLTKYIIAYYPNVEELKLGEMKLIEEYFDDVYCMNMVYSSSGFASGDKHPQFGKISELSHMYGRTRLKETKQKISDYRFGKKPTEQTKRKISDSKSGEKCYRSSITDHIARLIKIRIAEAVKNKLIAEEFNTTIGVVKHIKYNHTWKHVIIL
jgi:NUMOD3 motif